MPGKSFTTLYIHAVWAVKNREPILIASLRKQLFSQIIEICKEKEIKFIRINGIEDHVHFLFQLHPTQSVSKIIKDIKGTSSRWLNTTGGFENSFIWQEGYGAFSVSPKDLDTIISYIERQVEHHSNSNTLKEFESC